MQNFGMKEPVLLNINASVFSFLCLSLFITCCWRVWAKKALSGLSDLKIKIRVRGQKAPDSRFREILSRAAFVEI